MLTQVWSSTICCVFSFPCIAKPIRHHSRTMLTCCCLCVLYTACLHLTHTRRCFAFSFIISSGYFFLLRARLFNFRVFFCGRCCNTNLKSKVIKEVSQASEAKKLVSVPTRWLKRLTSHYQALLSVRIDGFERKHFYELPLRGH